MDVECIKFNTLLWLYSMILFIGCNRGIGCANSLIWLTWLTKSDFNVGHDKNQNWKNINYLKTLQTIKHTEHSVCHILGMLGTDTSLSTSSGRLTIWNVEV
jgi:hypothetical protein